MRIETEREIRGWAVGYCEAVDNQETAPVKEADWILDLLEALDAARETNTRLNRLVTRLEGAFHEAAKRPNSKFSKVANAAFLLAEHRWKDLYEKRLAEARTFPNTTDTP